MAVALDTQLGTIASLRAAGVRRVRFYPNGALHSAELFPLTPGELPAAPEARRLADTEPPPPGEMPDEVDESDLAFASSGGRIELVRPPFPPSGEPL
jgi:hypothetical protein